MRDKKYYFHVEGSRQGEIEPKQGEIEVNLGNGRWGEGRLKRTFENSEIQKTQVSIQSTLDGR